jgi:hypothetical protein
MQNLLHAGSHDSNHAGSARIENDGKRWLQSQPVTLRGRLQQAPDHCAWERLELIRCAHWEREFMTMGDSRRWESHRARGTTARWCCLARV